MTGILLPKDATISDPSMVQKAVTNAIAAPRGTKAACRHSFRHCQWLRHAGLRPGSATHLLERRQDIRTIQELLGHKEVSISLIDTHVLTAVRSGYEVQPTSWYWPNRWFSDP